MKFKVGDTVIVSESWRTKGGLQLEFYIEKYPGFEARTFTVENLTDTLLYLKDNKGIDYCGLYKWKFTKLINRPNTKPEWL